MMFCFESIIPGRSIGNLILHDSEQDIILKIGDKYIKEDRNNSFVYFTDSIKVWVDKTTRKVCQISAGKGFQAYFKDSITIGLKLNELKRFGALYCENETVPVFMIEGISGICFETEEDSNEEDEDDWDEKIAWISVFEPE